MQGAIDYDFWLMETSRFACLGLLRLVGFFLIPDYVLLVFFKHLQPQWHNVTCVKMCAASPDRRGSVFRYQGSLTPVPCLLTGLEYSKQKLCKLFIGYGFMAVFHEKYFWVMQVSLRDALRSGIDNIGLQEIIGDAVLCLIPTCLHNTVSIILNICIIE